MTNKLTLILLIAAITIATILHGAKNKGAAINTEQENINKVGIAMREAATKIPETTNIAIHLVSVNSAVFLWSRYFLAPRYCSADPNEVMDTVLTLSPVNLPDSTLNTITANRKIIWSKTDDQYRYYLTASH